MKLNYLFENEHRDDLARFRNLFDSFCMLARLFQKWWLQLDWNTWFAPSILKFQIKYWPELNSQQPVVVGCTFSTKWILRLLCWFCRRSESSSPGRSVTDPDLWRNLLQWTSGTPTNAFTNGRTHVIFSADIVTNPSRQKRFGNYSDNSNHCGIFSFTPDCFDFSITCVHHSRTRRPEIADASNVAFLARQLQLWHPLVHQWSSQLLSPLKKWEPKLHRWHERHSQYWNPGLRLEKSTFVFFEQSHLKEGRHRLRSCIHLFETGGGIRKDQPRLLWKGPVAVGMNTSSGAIIPDLDGQSDVVSGHHGSLCWRGHGWLPPWWSSGCLGWQRISHLLLLELCKRDLSWGCCYPWSQQHDSSEVWWTNFLSRIVVGTKLFFFSEFTSWNLPLL